MFNEENHDEFDGHRINKISPISVNQKLREKTNEIVELGLSVTELTEQGITDAEIMNLKNINQKELHIARRTVEIEEDFTCDSGLKQDVRKKLNEEKY